MEEIWKDIKGYEGLYQVSNLGRVKSLERYKKCGNFFRIRKEKILKCNKNKFGYIVVNLSKNKKISFFRVNRLVYEAFNGEIPQGMQVNHINEDKTDNRLENLNLMTPKDNINWGTRTKKCAEKLLNREDQSKQVYQYTLDGELIAVWKSGNEAGRNGYNPKHISACCKGKEKKHKGFIWRYA
jgi:hypothetical protein